MNEAYELAAKCSKKSGDSNKVRYDSRAKCVDIVEGDRVLFRNVDPPGTGKLASYWDHVVYVVTKRRGVVYDIREYGGTRTKRVHRNLLKQVNELTPPETKSDSKNVVDKVRKKKVPSGNKLIRSKGQPVLTSPALQQVNNDSDDSDIAPFPQRTVVMNANQDNATVVPLGDGERIDEGGERGVGERGVGEEERIVVSLVAQYIFVSLLPKRNLSEYHNWA